MFQKHVLWSTVIGASLGLFSLAPARVEPAPIAQSIATSAVPSGTILPFGGDVLPAGYLLCDGTQLLRSAYPRLYAAIGESWGATTNFTFALPDLRGRFLRGVDGTAGNDPNANSRVAINPGGNVGNQVGSLQADGRKGFSGNFGGNTSSDGAHSHSFTTYNDDWDEDDGNGGQHQNGWADDKPGSGGQANATSQIGDHHHSFSVNVTFTGEPETRPKNVYVNYIIKT